MGSSLPVLNVPWAEADLISTPGATCIMALDLSRCMSQLCSAGPIMLSQGTQQLMFQSRALLVHQFPESARQRSAKLLSRTLGRLLLDTTLFQVLTKGLLDLPVEPSCLAQGHAKGNDKGNGLLNLKTYM